jgi:two-component system, sensor histidine kinase YesM
MKAGCPVGYGWRNKFSFKSKLLIGISAIILFTFNLAGIISYHSYLRLFKEEVREQYVKANGQAMAQLELRIQELYRVSNYIVFNPTIEKIIAKLSAAKEVNPANQYFDQEQIVEQLRQVKFDAPQLLSLYLYDMGGTNYYHALMKEAVEPINQGVFEEIRSKVQTSKGELVWMRKSIPSPIEPSGFRDVIVASRWMRNNNAGIYGMLVMVIDEQFLTKSFTEIGTGGQGRVYLFDQAEKLLYENDRNSAAPELSRFLGAGNSSLMEEKGEDTFLYTTSYSPDISFTLVSRVSLSDIFRKSRKILNISLFSGLVSILFSGLLIVLLSGRLFRPLKELVQAMRTMRQGNFDIRIEPRTRDELGFLAESFNSMASNVNDLIKKVYLSQLSEREAELKALQAQLNPHFLYNTLNGLYWKLYLQNDRDTANLVSSLSSLMQYSLARIKKRTTLREELEQTRNYLNIQTAFIQNGFDARILADDDVLDCSVQRFLLQPLVENVFVHAFRNQTGPKMLEIRAYRLAPYLMIEIEDNGCGMEASQVEGIFAAEGIGDRDSLGVRSVIRRINLVYGQPYRLDITSRPEQGTTVHLFLPLGTEPDFNNEEVPDERETAPG